MTERGLPIVDGAPACPFVAFEDDRDERAASPDHRHRCYAEAQPAPRALAHQEAYCLASAFPVCPTFQDWARREAARSRTDPPRSLDSLAAAATAEPQRNPPRDWSAPPPWSSREGSEERSGAGEWATEAEDADVGTSGEAAAGAPGGEAAAVPSQGRGLSGSYADRVASDAVPGPGGNWDGGLEDGEADGDDVPVGEVPPYAPPLAAGPASAERREPSRAEARGPELWDDDEAELEPEPPVRRRRERDSGHVAGLAGGAGAAGGRGSGGGGGGGAGGGGGGGPRHERRRDAPEWERARPMEAYPTLRSRRLQELSIPPILVAVVALALAAAVLFALPGLLGFGNPSTGGSTAPTTPIQTPLITAAPTPVPQPTDQIYVVKSGDTLSRIAGRFGVSLDDLIAANAETLPDPNKLQIGDRLIIPAKTPSELPAAS
ncbi:MAG TPA: LysM peptidoglycan-binding domain-containing protein [Candidatus Limnocylindrales bacterium]|nr:LysM peptidoglycan-binding domain-containing protein [Candidatus Limnocylindrales bacterium]